MSENIWEKYASVFWNEALYPTVRFKPEDIEFVRTVSDSGGPGSWTVHCGKLSDGRWVGWGPSQTKADASLLNQETIDYYGLENWHKCPTCGHDVYKEKK